WSLPRSIAASGSRFRPDAPSGRRGLFDQAHLLPRATSVARVLAGGPRGLVLLGLIAPCRPPGSSPAREQLEAGSGAACLDQRAELDGGVPSRGIAQP